MMKTLPPPRPKPPSGLPPVSQSRQAKSSGAKKAGAKRRSKSSSGFPQLRLLPVMIVVAASMLTVRVTDIWTVSRHWQLAHISFNTSLAQQPPPPGGRQPGVQTPQPPLALTAPSDSPSTQAGSALTAPAAPATASGSTPTPGPTPGATPSANQASLAAYGKAPPAAGSSTVASITPPPGSTPPPAVPASAPSENAPPAFSQNELDVLQRLSERRAALDAHEQDLVTRENLVKAAEQRIDKKIAEMKVLQTSVQGMLNTVDNQDQAKLASLVKIYENMKPKDAAKIFEQLDMPILLGVIGHMKEQKVAPIMESMDPMKAKLVTDAMAIKRGTKAEGGTESGG